MHSGRSRGECIECGKAHILGKSAVKVAVVKPASVVHGNALLWAFRGGRMMQVLEIADHKILPPSVQESHASHWH